MTTYLCNYRWRPRAAALLNDSRVPESLRVAARVVTVTKVNDIEALTAHNEHFIQACRQGSWEMLQLILGSDFRYLDGGSGEQWEQGPVRRRPAGPSRTDVGDRSAVDPPGR